STFRAASMKPRFPGSFSKTAVSLALAATLAACGQAEQAPKAQAAHEVGVYTVETRPLTLATVLPGRSAAFRIAEVRPQANGIVEKRLFDEGAQVEKGQQLYQIDDSVHQAEYDRAKA